eukprot:CAMPEP_0181240752 /NCGR_PEP_ID=MMETSP1096-20121128/40717_1 /TAXON_ID=156174 ORGANISM="Chrysochromulina ericina, Strain CCMP281" /NCGR_SAMPLE_ID=MMETSP1096 /ASSEMBLY_ACC=CAM_ASM_000453 /LENGTH=128 /DNA_ID=CAMNT_0023336701 /DNA_START=78 /DNA_END=460 /DNA_ORIENTATION=+
MVEVAAAGAEESTTQSEGPKHRRGRPAGHRARRELLDSEGFALQWRSSQRPLGSEHLQLDQASVRTYAGQGPGYQKPDEASTFDASVSSSKSGSSSSDSAVEVPSGELPEWARATRRCLRLSNSEKGV